MIGRAFALVLLATILGAGGACGASDVSSSSGSRSPEPQILGLVFAFGPGAKNVLDTTRGTFTKDMILASPVTVPMTLTAEETARIAGRLAAIDLWSSPEVYSTAETGEGGWMEPHASYRFEVTTARGTKIVEWEDAVSSSDPRAAKLRSLARLIQGIITSKPEYRSLPEPEGGYL